ncbi:hypothetical protein T02_14657 [Trichinella nativa]|uniref:Uncharacterized protein n=1 Tax=Trichinella nativa TaxID=6335 RepID=A0A0V1LG44_9BILA|nr:hypothetical protein T02_14657 [Trichinella nativa]
MHNSSSSASNQQQDWFNRSLKATSFLLRVFVADAMVSTFHRSLVRLRLGGPMLESELQQQSDAQVQIDQTFARPAKRKWTI